MSSLPLPFAAFTAGLVSFLTPCVLPLVPGYISLVSGAGVDELKQKSGRVMRSVMLNSTLFILGFSVVFLALGAVASGLGQLVHQHIAALTKAAGVVIIVLGLHQTGLVPIRALYADKRFHALPAGAAVGFGWTPCVGPILAVILTFAAAESTMAKGVSLLAMYSLGLAIPFLLTALSIERFMVFYQNFRHHLHTLEVTSGAMMIVLGLLILTNHLTILITWMNRVVFFRAIAERFL
jgi:cytochrome c-type biogenesis protein